MNKNQFNRLFSPIDFIEARLDLLHDGYLYFNEVKQSAIVEDEDIEVKRIKEKNDDLTVLNTRQNKKTKTETNILEEVLILNYSKKFTNSIIKKAIEKH
ncbi:hypothetical protein [Flavobacterium sp. PL002]|uniref:hypothetical protein n=1 Tax=Flavobacterium sp. PL002 TaxID=1897058 RepID=UPI001787FB6A|nr:hypothetical protein [Flavobacterium sp. PL002]MBE0393367.1 hypothetical protein [Flavobacterium sp. PL002]